VKHRPPPLAARDTPPAHAAIGESAENSPTGLAGQQRDHGASARREREPWGVTSRCPESTRPIAKSSPASNRCNRSGIRVELRAKLAYFPREIPRSRFPIAEAVRPRCARLTLLHDQRRQCAIITRSKIMGDGVQSLRGYMISGDGAQSLRGCAISGDRRKALRRSSRPSERL